MKKLATSVIVVIVSAATMLGLVELGRADTPVVQIAQAGSGSTVTIPPFEPATDTATAQPLEAKLPDPAAEPADSASLVWKLYKAGHLIPALIVAAFFALLLLQRWIEWLRTGYRKLVVASTLAGLAMLAERAANGETPNMMMIMGAFGAALALYVKGEGEKKA